MAATECVCGEPGCSQFPQTSVCASCGVECDRPVLSPSARAHLVDAIARDRIDERKRTLGTVTTELATFDPGPVLRFIAHPRFWSLAQVGQHAPSWCAAYLDDTGDTKIIERPTAEEACTIALERAELLPASSG